MEQNNDNLMLCSVTLVLTHIWLCLSNTHYFSTHNPTLDVTEASDKEKSSGCLYMVVYKGIHSRITNMLMTAKITQKHVHLHNAHVCTLFSCYIETLTLAKFVDTHNVFII